MILACETTTIDEWHPLQVEEISLSMTTLRGADCVRQYYPNTKMTGANIINLSRSDNKFEIFNVSHFPHV